MIQKINKIKDLVYETEGLLELLQIRQDKFPELSPLIRQRLEDVVRLFDQIQAESPAALPDAAPAPIVEGLPQEDENVNIIMPSDPIEMEKIEVKEEAAAQENIVRKAPAFCLNDRFRFRRAIFGGSDAEFNIAMDRIAAMASYDEAENYFLEEMGLNPEDEDVADFMEIIRIYFGQ